MQTAVRLMPGLHRRSPDALDACLAELMTIDTVVEQLMSCRRVADVARVFTDSILEHSEADYVSVFMASDGAVDVVPVASAYRKSPTNDVDLWRAGKGVAARCWHSAHPVFIDDASTLDDESKWPEATQLCAVPARLGDDVVGVICVASNGIDLGGELTALTRTTQLAAIAIGNARAVERLERNLHRTRTLSHTHERLASLTDPKATRQMVCHALFETLEIAHASVHRIDTSGTAVECGMWEQNADGEIIACDAVPTVASKAREIVVSRWADREQDSWGNELVHTEADAPCREQAIYEGRERGEDQARDQARDQSRDQGPDHSYHQACALPIYGVHGLTGVLVMASRNKGRMLDDGESHMVRSLAGQLSSTLDRQSLSAELAHLAFHDKLTGLPNRRYFESELERLLKSANDDDAMNGGHVLFVDLDGFKLVNETHGHAVGDRLLQLTAHRLAENLNPGTVLARMGGDEFALITLPTTDVQATLNDSSAEVAALTQGLTHALDAPFSVDGHALKVAISVGVSSWPEDGKSADELLRHADYAMYEAKQTTGSKVVEFDTAYAARRRQRTQIEIDLRKGLENDEFNLVFQPQFDLSNDTPIGVEALVRWHHPERGLVSPAEFIPVAEELGCISAIGSRVLDLALQQVAAWRDSPLETLRMSVNIAAPQFQHDDFAKEIMSALERHKVSPNQLELEVTESIVMRDINSVAHRLDDLRGAGMRIAIDDFGTGYSSLSYLQDLPLDVLKIDRAFVSRLSDDNADDSLVRTILALAEALDLETVAEGVETIEQCNIIRRMGCDIVQGYLYSPPVPAKALQKTLNSIARHDGDSYLRSAA